MNIDRKEVKYYVGCVEVADDATDYEIEEKIKEELDFTIDIYR